MRFCGKKLKAKTYYIYREFKRESKPKQKNPFLIKVRGTRMFLGSGVQSGKMVCIVFAILFLIVTLPIRLIFIVAKKMLYKNNAKDNTKNGGLK